MWHASGACLGTGIERDKVGDILITGESGAQILCTPNLVEHLEQALTQVGDMRLVGWVGWGWVLRSLCWLRTLGISLPASCGRDWSLCRNSWRCCWWRGQLAGQLCGVHSTGVGWVGRWVGEWVGIPLGDGKCSVSLCWRHLQQSLQATCLMAAPSPPPCVGANSAGADPDH